jgi:hypothetical protein
LRPEGEQFILFDDFKDVRVTASQQLCNKNSTLVSKCSLYVKKGRSVVFMDFCGVESKRSPTSKLYGVSLENVPHDQEFSLALHPVPSCESIKLSQEDDEDVWQRIPKFLNKFKCAKMNSGSHSTTYLVLNYFYFN